MQYGDIIIEKSGGSETQAVGRVVLFNKNEDDYSFSNFTARIRVTSELISSNYLHIYLNHTYNLGYTYNIQNGVSGLKNLDLNKYLEIKIPIPEMNIQQKIINEIDLIERTEIGNIIKIKKLNSGIFEELQSAIQGKIKVKLDNLCIIQSGGTPKREVAEYWSGTINWLRSEVCQNCYVYEDAVNEKITELGLLKSSA